MTHCTVCGAAAREGAKFCTSCGARLVDTAATAPEPSDTATTVVAEPSGADVPAEDNGGQPDPESTWGPVVADDAAGEAERLPAGNAETAEPEAVIAEPAESPEYTASWPSSNDDATAEPSDEAPADEAPAPPEEAWSSWSLATTEEPSETPESPPAVPEDTEPDRSDPMAESHHGASQWESWSPEASGEGVIPAASGEVGASVRRLLDDLADRIDRLIDPATIQKRGVDADELADQLDRWSTARTDADGLLEVVRAVRTSPRDVDALTRLADRAPDLELLVRHYQAITSDAGEWSRKLRDQRSSDEGDA